ncbi:MAG: COX15/CtaA family protein [Gemmatimonadaceae bacterium]
MKALRRLALSALAIAFLQIVFGAIVRITNSGMGCGDHWPKCLGHWVPPMDRPDLVIEVTHRYLALLLGVAILALVGAAWARRGRQAGVTGRGGVLRAALLALALYVVIAQLGRVIVQAGLRPLVIATHLVLAMSLLATLATAVLRAGGLAAHAADRQKITPRTRRAAMAAAALALLVIVLGALTANLPGAAGACLGFPACTQAYVPTNGAAHVQITHRVLAFLLLLHLVGVVMAARKRGEIGAVTSAARIALAAVVLQIVVAAVLVTTELPRPVQSLHQAVGTLVWLATFAYAALARRAALREAPAAAEAAPAAAERTGEGSARRVRVPSRTPARTPVRTPVATSAQPSSPTVAFVCTTGPNAKMVRLDPDDDAGFAAAEAGGSEAIPPADDQVPDVPALAETGSWSLADLRADVPAHDEPSGDDGAPPSADAPRPSPRGEAGGRRGDEGNGTGGSGGAGGTGGVGGPVNALAAPLVAAALIASRGEAMAIQAAAQESAATHDVPAVVASPVAPAPSPKRPPSLAVIIARGAMS